MINFQNKDSVKMTDSNLLHNIKLKTENFEKICVLGNGNIVFCDDELKMFNIRKRSFTHVLLKDEKKHGILDKILCSPNGTFISRIRNRNLYLLNSTTFEIINHLNIKSSEYTQVFSPDGKYIAYFCGDHINILCLHDMTLKRFPLITNNLCLSFVTFSPNNKCICIGYICGNVKILNLNENEIFDLTKHENEILSAVYSSNEKYIYTICRKEIRVFDNEKKTLIYNVKCNCENIIWKFSHNLKCGDCNDIEVTIKKWKFLSSKIWYFLSFGTKHCIYSATISPDEKYMAFNHEKSVAIWEIEGKKHICNLVSDFIIILIDYSPNNKYIITKSMNNSYTSSQNLISIQIWKNPLFDFWNM